MGQLELKPSAVLNVQQFTDFETYRPNNLIGAAVKNFPLDHKGFSASRAMLSMPSSRLVFQRSFPRRFDSELGADGCQIVVPLSAEYYQEANGRIVDHNTIVLLRGLSPFRAYEPSRNTSVIIGFQSVMQTRGWADYDKGYEFLAGSPQCMQRLQSVLWNIAQSASDCVNPSEFADLAGAFQESLYGALDDVLVVQDTIQARPRSSDHHRRLIARLDEFIREYPSVPLYSEDLAQHVGGSVRTLQTAARTVHGMSLHQYLRLKRLWLVRRQLTKGTPGLSVKLAAQSNGFWHMSEFSRFYNIVFGELPSATLVRAREHLSQPAKVSHSRYR